MGKFLWISGLNKDVKATEIREEFEKNELGDRPLRSCKVAVSKKNGGSAFAFCEIGTAELADKIIALYHAKDMCGKIVQIKKVTCDPTLPKAKQVEQQKRKAAESGDTLLVPKRIKTTTTNGTDKADGSKVINLKKKAEEREKEDLKKQNTKLSKDLAKDSKTESVLRRENDDLKKRLKRKRDDLDRARRDINRNRDELRRVEGDIRKEENQRLRLKDDLASAKRHLDKVLQEIRSLEMSSRNYQEEEQRHRIQLERRRLEDEKRRFAEEREKLERERRDAEYKRPSRYDSGPPARDQWNQPPPSMSAMPSRHGGHPPSRDAPAGLWPGNQQTNAWPSQANPTFQRTIISYDGGAQRGYGGAPRGAPRGRGSMPSRR